MCTAFRFVMIDSNHVSSTDKNHVLSTLALSFYLP